MKGINNWKIVGNIATAFGIAFIVFAVFQAILTYETMQYSPYSSSLIQLSMLTDMLPYLLYAVLALLVGGVLLRTIKENVEKEEATPETPSGTQQETQN